MVPHCFFGFRIRVSDPGFGSGFRIRVSGIPTPLSHSRQVQDEFSGEKRRVQLCKNTPPLPPLLRSVDVNLIRWGGGASFQATSPPFNPPTWQVRDESSGEKRRVQHTRPHFA